MSNKSYNEFKKLLEEEGYFFSTSLENFIGFENNFDNWNYNSKNIFNISNEGINTIKSENILSNISIDKRYFFFIKLPKIIVLYSYSKGEMVEYYTVGPYIFLINTLKKKINPDKVKIIKKYSIGSKSIFKFFNSIIKKSLVRNNKKFMQKLTFRIFNNQKPSIVKDRINKIMKFEINKKSKYENQFNKQKMSNL